MMDKDTPKIEAEDWKYTPLWDENLDCLIKEAPVGGLLAMFQSAARQGKDVGEFTAEFLKALLEGRYTDAQIRSTYRLTRALNKASCSSTIVGVALIFFAAVQAFVSLLSWWR